MPSLVAPLPPHPQCFLLGGRELAHGHAQVIVIAHVPVTPQEPTDSGSILTHPIERQIMHRLYWIASLENITPVMTLSKSTLLGAIRVIRMTSRSVSIFFAALVISLAQSCSPLVGIDGGESESTEERIVYKEYVGSAASEKGFGSVMKWVKR